jgi:hypothetical protein
MFVVEATVLTLLAREAADLLEQRGSSMRSR